MDRPQHNTSTSCRPTRESGHVVLYLNCLSWEGNQTGRVLFISWLVSNDAPGIPSLEEASFVRAEGLHKSLLSQNVKYGPKITPEGLKEKSKSATLSRKERR